MRIRASGLGGYVFTLDHWGVKHKHLFRSPGRCTLCNKIVMIEGDLLKAVNGNVIAFNSLISVLENLKVEICGPNEPPLLCYPCYKLETPDLSEEEWLARRSDGPFA